MVVYPQYCGCNGLALGTGFCNKKYLVCVPSDKQIGDARQLLHMYIFELFYSDRLELEIRLRIIESIPLADLQTLILVKRRYG